VKLAHKALSCISTCQHFQPPRLHLMAERKRLRLYKRYCRCELATTRQFLAFVRHKAVARQILFAFSASLFTIFIYTCAAVRWRAVNNKRTLCYAREQLKKVIWTAVIAVPLTLASFSWVSHPAAETSVAARTLLWPIEGHPRLPTRQLRWRRRMGHPQARSIPHPRRLLWMRPEQTSQK
jgi:hypothetical protein